MKICRFSKRRYKDSLLRIAWSPLTTILDILAILDFSPFPRISICDIRTCFSGKWNQSTQKLCLIYLLQLRCIFIHLNNSIISQSLSNNLWLFTMLEMYKRKKEDVCACVWRRMHSSVCGCKTFLRQCWTLDVIMYHLWKKMYNKRLHSSVVCVTAAFIISLGDLNCNFFSLKINTIDL